MLNILLRGIFPWRGPTGAVLAAAALLAARSVTGKGAAPPPDATFNDADVAFAQDMIAHHEQAVRMSALAEIRGADPELKVLAAQIQAAQAPEITTMSAWLDSWGKPARARQGHDGHGMPGMMSDADLAALRAADGTDFDRMFAGLMASHHDGAIQMAQRERANGTNPGATTLATKIETQQTAEMATLRSILDRL